MNAPEARAMTETYVLNERDARGVVTLTLNRPQQFNALSEEMMTALQAELDAVARDGSARVVVIAGRGKAFCPGHDLKQMKANPSVDYYRRLFAQCAQLMLTIQRLPLPVIARVHGIATAAGCQLVAMCDLAVAASRRALRGERHQCGAVLLDAGRGTVAQCRSQGSVRDAGHWRFHRCGDGPGARARQSRRAGRSARCRSREAGGIDHRQAASAMALGKELYYRQLETGIEAAYQMAGADDGLQHDRRVGPGRRAGLHGKAQADLGAVIRGARTLGLDRLRRRLGCRRRVDRAAEEVEQWRSPLGRTGVRRRRGVASPGAAAPLAAAVAGPVVPFRRSGRHSVRAPRCAVRWMRPSTAVGGQRQGQCVKRQTRSIRQRSATAVRASKACASSAVIAPWRANAGGRAATRSSASSTRWRCCLAGRRDHAQRAVRNR